MNYRILSFWTLLTPILITEFDIPQPILSQLLEAAETYEIGKIESVLTQLEKQLPESAPLTAHLTTFITLYDMEGLTAELAKVAHEQDD
jgi:hypothetical protein